ncbi:MAG TPA: YIP1 family protein [Rubrobacter sp.]|nr:YIP1 family protein [Rubrobacter sp.]
MREGTESKGHQTDAAARDFEIVDPFSSLLSTTRDVLFSPQRFFDELPPDGPLGAPVLYFLICSSITTVINVVSSLIFLAGPVGIALATGSLDTGLLIRVLTIFVVASLVVLPALFVAGFFASVLILHAFIRLIVGRDQKGLPATLRVSCYAVGAPAAVAWIPLAGILAVFYCFYLHTTGLKRVHRISTARSLGSILILTALLLALAAVVAAYDYSMIREAMK